MTNVFEVLLCLKNSKWEETNFLIISSQDAIKSTSSYTSARECFHYLVSDFLFPRFASQKTSARENYSFWRVHASPHQLTDVVPNIASAHTTFCWSTNDLHTLIWPTTRVVSVFTADFPEKLTLFKMWNHQWGGTNARSVRTVCQFLAFSQNLHGLDGGVGTLSDYKPRQPHCPKQDTVLNTALSSYKEKKKWEVTVCTNQAHRPHRIGLSHQLKLRWQRLLDIFLFT